VQYSTGSRTAPASEEEDEEYEEENKCIAYIQSLKKQGSRIDKKLSCCSQVLRRRCTITQVRRDDQTDGTSRSVVCVQLKRSSRQ
jgi:hypothetical protein